MKTYVYVIGVDPYKNSHKDYETKGNGEWGTHAQNVEEALKVIFDSMPFPTEATGRNFFLEGVSLPGVHADEVIQVWSDEPKIIQRTRTAIKNYSTRGLHDGQGHDYGLHLELKVTDIEKYTSPVRALLTDAPAAPSDGTNLSPMGAGLIKFDQVKHDMQMAVQDRKMDLMRKQWETESLSDTLEENIKQMEQQLGVLHTYLYGTRYRTQLTRGKHGTGRYAVFQNRQFLSEEIALLGNFESFDFKKMEDLEKWLVKSGRIWKFLPFERCILATRIRQERKDYGDPILNLHYNVANMQNIIWIRDGENVCHVDVEFDFPNAVFPSKDQFNRALQVCQNHLWHKAFKWQPPKNWHDQELEPGQYDVMGQMCREPLDEEEPYCTSKILKARFHKIEDWLASGHYTELLDKQIRQAVHDYLRGVNKEQMVFAVLLQGIVDNTQLLDIPKGTDLFNWENIDRYFTLLNDYTHALPWHGLSDKITPYLDGKVQPGDWIVAFINEHIPATTQFGNGTNYKESPPVLFQVNSLEEVELTRYVANKCQPFKAIKPVINYYPIKRRRSRGEDYWSKIRTKAPIKLVLKNSKFIKVPMPPSLAEKILDDRDWKKTNQWAVPIMVNYAKIIAALKNPVNATVIKWDNYDDR